MNTNDLRSVERPAPSAGPAIQPALPPAPGAQVWLALSALGAQLQTLASTNIAGGNAPAPAVLARPATIDALKDEFIRAKELAGRSLRYTRALGYSLKGFLDCHGKRAPWEIGVFDVEEWLHAQEVSLRTRAGYLGDLRTFFGFALKRGYIAGNPAMAVDMPEPAAGSVGVHTPAQAAAVLEFARATDADICRALAVRYFGGLRTAESERVQETFIFQTHIEISCEKSKTRARRLVTIQPNLWAWLAIGGKLPSPRVTDRRVVDFIAKLKTKTGIPWPHNVTRHSFCSYHLAKFENAALTALEAGHSESMLFRHYRAVVTKSQAEEFFTILPARPPQ